MRLRRRRRGHVAAALGGTLALRSVDLRRDGARRDPGLRGVPGESRSSPRARLDVGRMLELGTGTGETARRLLERHPEATSSSGLTRARRCSRRPCERSCPDERVRFVEARLQEPLPAGPFDLVVSSLAIHHLDGRRRPTCSSGPGVSGSGGRFVLADLIVPGGPSRRRIPSTDPGYDKPSTDRRAAGLAAGTRASARSTSLAAGRPRRRSSPRPPG